MRVLTMILVSAATILVPAFASADPAPAQSAPAPAVQTAAAPSDAAQAPAAQAPQAMASASSGNNPDEVVCRMSPPATGSRLGGARECHTAREWNRRLEDDQRILATTQQHGLGATLNK